MYGSGAGASGLQVSPISLTLQSHQNADGLTLMNTGHDKVSAQIRVYHWTQDSTGDQLQLSRGLLASPPMLSLNPSEQQLVRIIKTNTQINKSAGVEDAYRLLINELPVDTTNKKPGIQFVLSYSVPVFIQPKSIEKPQPILQWQMQRQPSTKQITLQVSNSGNAHAQLAALSFVDKRNNHTVLARGLLGYVLPGATMTWVFELPPTVLTTGGQFEVLMNGDKIIPDITLSGIDH